MSFEIADVTKEHEALIQFLYMAPVGLIQASLDGEISMINPVSAQLLMPLATDCELTNLFDALKTVMPDLRERVAAFADPHGTICDAQRVKVPPRDARQATPQILALTLMKLDDRRLMGVLQNVTQTVIRERLLRQNEAWLNAILIGVTDYAVIRLNSAGIIYDWNVSIGHLTGFDAASAVGQPFSIFYPSGGTTTDRVLDRLREADENGWSLDDGWRVKVNGTRFWGSGMITPLRPRTATDATARRLTEVADGEKSEGRDEPAYCLIIRDITERRVNSEIERNAMSCDPLTGVLNHAAFVDAVRIELVRSRRSPRQISVAMFGIDSFGDLLSTGGLQAANAVLMHIASLLVGTFREVDVLARVGESRFAVLLPSADLQSASAVAERLQEAARSNRLVVGGLAIPFTISGAVVTRGSDTTSLDELMNLVTLALEAAQQSGFKRVAIAQSGTLDAADRPT